MTADDSPEPDLKDRNLLVKDAPDSWFCSEDDPAEGKVSEIVDVEDAVSVMTVRPLESVVMDDVEADFWVGDVRGILGNSSNGVKRAENSLVVFL
jgi:hypothetical protein